MYALVKFLADAVIDSDSVILNADDSLTFDLTADSAAFVLGEVKASAANDMMARLRKAQNLGSDLEWVIVTPQTLTTRAPRTVTATDGSSKTYGTQTRARYYIPQAVVREATAEESAALNKTWGERQAKADSIRRETASRRQSTTQVATF